jgi:hypothetical protein
MAVLELQSAAARAEVVAPNRDTSGIGPQLGREEEEEVVA